MEIEMDDQNTLLGSGRIASLNDTGTCSVASMAAAPSTSC
jgi:hypothetical protein